MLERRKILDADDARSCLAAAAQSGLSRAEWARSEGIDARSLNAWRLNLERETERAASPSDAVRFIELVPRRPVESAPMYRVRCGELVVEVETDFDEDVLHRLLGVVLSC